MKQYGPIIADKVGPAKLVYVGDPEMVKQMHACEGRYPNRGPGMAMETDYCRTYNKTNSLASM